MSEVVEFLSPAGRRSAMEEIASKVVADNPGMPDDLLTRKIADALQAAGPQIKKQVLADAARSLIEEEAERRQ
jgi:NaMN:DMB phosphoribosyltransferase